MLTGQHFPFRSVHFTITLIREHHAIISFHHRITVNALSASLLIFNHHVRILTNGECAL